MKLVAYLRVSTDRQAEQGLGLDVQDQAIRKWAKSHGHRIVLWTRDEGISGSNGVETREGLYEALEAVKGSAEGLVIYNLDRLARNLSVQEAILASVWESGAAVFSLGDGGEVLQDDPDDPMRTAMRQMRGVFAQLERAMIAKRMRDGRRRKAELGGFAFGSPAYGYRAENRSLVPADVEQAALIRIRELRASGASLREIAEALTAEGYRPKRSTKWHPETLRRIVARLADAV
jgi:DNA invertase Pin-like site-specific DNA recombinase